MQERQRSQTCEGTSLVSASEAVEEAILRAGELWPELHAIEVLSLEPEELEDESVRRFRALVRPRAPFSSRPLAG